MNPDKIKGMGLDWPTPFGERDPKLNQSIPQFSLLFSVG